MPSMVINQTITLNSVAYTTTRTVTNAQELLTGPTAVAAAFTGTLTTRTDNTTGTLTMGSSGHGITTSAIFDLYWSGGSQYNITAGTVSGTSIPFSLGSGDNLPTAASTISATVRTANTTSITGNNVTGLLVSGAIIGSDWYGRVTYAQANGTLITSYVLTPTAPTQEWDLGSNPFSGVTVGKVYFSQGNIDTTRTLVSNLLFS